MPFELRFYGEDPAVTLNEIRSLLNIGPGATIAVASVAETVVVPDEKPAPTVATPRTRRAAPKKDEPAQVDLEEAIAEKTAAAEPSVNVTKDALRTKLIELMNVKGETVPSELLVEKFGVSKIGELDPAQYGACFAAAEAALAED
jgi:hypothetical protein